jgi:hypothetical protein
MTDDELATLRALADRLVPGPPDDPDPGAADAGAAEAIARLLGAFSTDDPATAPIHARREGGFVPLDAVAELGWRIRLEGSAGLPEREFAGPVKGLIEQMSEGLALLDDICRRVHGSDFAHASAATRDQMLDAPDPGLGPFLELVLTLVLEATYGPPEYGGNRGGATWSALGWPGFPQPHGFTPAQVSEPDAGTTTTPDTVSHLRSKLPEGASWELGQD